MGAFKFVMDQAAVVDVGLRPFKMNCAVSSEIFAKDIYEGGRWKNTHTIMDIRVPFVRVFF